MLNLQNDRFGLGWRPELSSGILVHLGQIDFVEVIAENAISENNKSVPLETIARHVPVTIHGVSLGMSSAEPVATKRLDALARLIGRVGPVSWSEHLAFVRSGNIEIGHLAAPPRTRATIEGTVKNFDRARAITGSAPLLENIATLVDPPASEMNETDWLRGSLEATNAQMLLDLHNLYANSINYQFDAREALRSLPMERVRAVHLAGGRRITHPRTGAQRILDDHLHEVPDAVFELLELVAALAPAPLYVTIERDGNYPHFSQIMSELARARAAMARGRACRMQQLATAS